MASVINSDRPKVLIVEDEFIIASEIEERLSFLGYEVTGCVSTGEDALECVLNNPPDVALMDIVLAGQMDGISAARRIHHEYNVPVVFLTAHADEECLSRAKLAEPSGYVVKPFEERELRVAVEMALVKGQVEAQHRLNSRVLQESRDELRRMVENRTAALVETNDMLVREIERRSRAEKALKESEAKWRSLVQYAPDIIFTVDRDLTITFINHCPGELTSDEMVGTNLLEYVHPEYRDGAREKVLGVFETGRPDEYETSGVGPHGFEVYYHTRLGPVRHNGDVDSVILITHDITERRQVEQRTEQEVRERTAELRAAKDRLEKEIRESTRFESAMRQSRDQYMELLNNSPDGIVVFQNERVVFANQRLKESAWIDLQHLSLEALFSMVHAEDQAVLAERMKKRAAGLKIPHIIRFRFLRSPEEYYWLEASGANIDWQGRPAHLVFLRDVTGQVEAEAALAESEAKHRLLVDNAGEAICIIQDGRLVFANRRAAEITNMPLEKLVGSEHAFMIHPDDREMMIDRHQRRMQGEEAPEKYEFRFVDEDGSERVGRLKAVSTTWAGRPAALAFVSDITEQKQIEKKLRQSLEEQQTLLNEVNHRVKNNMAVITGLLRLQASRVDDEAVAAALEESRRRVAAMSLIHETLHKSQSLSGLALEDYIRSLVEGLFRAYGTNGAAVSLKLRASGHVLSPDQAVPCGLAVNELVTNSLKYAFHGRTSGTITIEADCSERGMTIVAADDGVGFPPGCDWRRADTLGLSLVTGLVERQLRGTIELLDRPGTAFRIEFPLRD